MKSLLPILMLAAGLAACSSGSAGPDAQAAAGVSEPEAMTASTGFTESDIDAMRPETEHSREILWRLKGSTALHQARH